MSRCVRQDYFIERRVHDSTLPHYRHDWVKARLLFLCDVFAIDLLAFAIMDNHTHKVLHVNLELANSWSNREVLLRWSKIGSIPLICQLYLDPFYRSKLNEIELTIVLEQVDQYRAKLSDISCFMSKFNYYVARRANKEDRVTGHFWEARFKSQALLDTDALLACMAYVDLNPLRAGKCNSLQGADYTSIQHRLLNSIESDTALLAPIRSTKSSANNRLPLTITLNDYVKYIDSIMDSEYLDKTGSKSLADNFSKTSDDKWLEVAKDFESAFTLSAGNPKLVSNFNSNAHASSRITWDEKRAINTSMAARLLDSLYPCDRTTPYT